MKKILVFLLCFLLMVPALAGAADYKFGLNGGVIRTADGASIPADPGNTDYQQYLRWKAAGGVPDPSQTLAEAQAAKMAVIDAAWKAHEQGGFSYLGKTIQSDPLSAQRITFAVFGAQAALAANQTYSGSWLCADGTLLPLTTQQVIEMAVAYSMFGLELYNHAQALFLQVQQADTADAVNAIPNW